eukprot:scaffold35307_cov63-Phaeocystis_antarctica.AAC.2
MHHTVHGTYGTPGALRTLYSSDPPGPSCCPAPQHGGSGTYVSAQGSTTTSERPAASPSSGETSALVRGCCTRAALSCSYGVKAASAGSAKASITNEGARSALDGELCHDGAFPAVDILA